MTPEWAKAFVAAQAEMPEITKDKTVMVKTKTGGSFKYSYADLAMILSKVRPVLAKNGLAVAQDVSIVSGQVSVTTRIYHVEGDVESFGPVVLNGGNDAQAAGSAITYARRYALCAALNIAADDDDDGQINKNSAGSEPVPAKARGSEPKVANAQAASPPQNSGEVTDAGAQQPSQAAPLPVASPDKSQSGGGAGGEVSSVPPSELWMLIQDAVANGSVKRVKVQLNAAALCNERGKPIPNGYEDVAKCDGDILEALVAKLGVAA